MTSEAAVPMEKMLKTDFEPASNLQGRLSARRDSGSAHVVREGISLTHFQNRVVERYRHRLVIGHELVEPLFYTCWMHWALREAMQMASEAVGGSFYYRLLLRSIRLRGMISGETPS